MIVKAYKNIFVDFRLIDAPQAAWDKNLVAVMIDFTTKVPFLAIDFNIYKDHMIPGPTFHLCANKYLKAANFPYVWNFFSSKEPGRNLDVVTDHDDVTIGFLLGRELSCREYPFIAEDFIDIMFSYGSAANSMVSMEHIDKNIGYAIDEYFFRNPLIRPVKFNKDNLCAIAWMIVSAARAIDHYETVFLPNNRTRDEMNVFYHATSLCFYASFVKKAFTLLDRCHRKKKPKTRQKFFFDLSVMVKPKHEKYKTMALRLSGTEGVNAIDILDDFRLNILRRLHDMLTSQNSCYRQTTCVRNSSKIFPDDSFRKLFEYFWL